MQIILQKAVFDNVKIKNYITKLVVEELNKLSEACYYPDWKKHYYELINLTGLTDDDIRKFTKRFYVESKIQVNLAQYGKVPYLAQDVGSNFLIILMYYFLNQKDIKTYSTIMIFYMIRQYSNFLHATLKYCKPEVFSYTLNHLNPTHLYSREKTIGNAIFHLSIEMKKRFTSGFLELDPNKIIQFIYEARSRIAQSQRSFNELYYKYEKEGMSIGKPYETETGEEVAPKELDKGRRIADLVSQKICVFKEVDYKALEEARKLTKINTSLSVLIVENLKDMSFIEDIKFIIELFLRDAKSIKQICGKDFLSYVRKLMGIKRTTKKVFFKQEINKLLIKILDKTKYKNRYHSLTQQTQFQINSFLSFYLTMYTRNLIC
jgi:hypothetical protein